MMEDGRDTERRPMWEGFGVHIVNEVEQQFCVVASGSIVRDQAVHVMR